MFLVSLNDTHAHISNERIILHRIKQSVNKLKKVQLAMVSLHIATKKLVISLDENVAINCHKDNRRLNGKACAYGGKIFANLVSKSEQSAACKSYKSSQHF